MSEIKKESLFKRDHYLLVKYLVFGVLFSLAILIFSGVMSSVVQYRNGISANNYASVSNVYNGPVVQKSPSIAAVSEDSEIYVEKKLTAPQAEQLASNTALTSTNGSVVMNADFVKKGLTYQPTYVTEFNATYTLENQTKEASVVNFEFPFPANTTDSEISNAKLIVDGEEIKNAKAVLDTYSTTSASQYDSYYDTYYDYNANTDRAGLRWEGEIAAGKNATVEISYNTVGVSVFTYEGIENPNGAQDFFFTTTINGIRSYDVIDGLSVDAKEFGDNSVTLNWNKENLYSAPTLSVEVGDKLNPSKKVGRVYFVMAPLYVLAMTILLFLSYTFGTKVKVFDLFLLTVLYTLYFPLVHYLSSFTVDPTMEVFSALNNVPDFSMPLYGAFAIAWIVIGGMMLYLFSRLSGAKFALKFIVPSLVLFLGFFPLVLTVPEYSILLTLLGITALLAIVIQSRIQMMKR